MATAGVTHSELHKDSPDTYSDITGTSRHTNFHIEYVTNTIYYKYIYIYIHFYILLGFLCQISKSDSFYFVVTSSTAYLHVTHFVNVPLNKQWHYSPSLSTNIFPALLLISLHIVLALDPEVSPETQHWYTGAVCCAESDVLIPELLYESVPLFHLTSRPQPSRLISARLWWTHAPSVLGRTVFSGNSTKTERAIGPTHTRAPPPKPQI